MGPLELELRQGRCLELELGLERGSLLVLEREWELGSLRVLGLGIRLVLGLDSRRELELELVLGIHQVLELEQGILELELGQGNHRELEPGQEILELELELGILLVLVQVLELGSHLAQELEWGKLRALE